MYLTRRDTPTLFGGTATLLYHTIAHMMIPDINLAEEFNDEFSNTFSFLPIKEIGHVKSVLFILESYNVQGIIFPNKNTSSVADKARPWSDRIINTCISIY